MVNRWIRDVIITVDRAGGFTPTGVQWVERIKHVRGEFRPTPIQSTVQWFMFAVCGRRLSAEGGLHGRRFRALQILALATAAIN